MTGKRYPGVLLGAVALVSALLGGCGRFDRFAAGLRSVGDAEAQQVVRRCLWAHGSFYRWTEHKSLRCTVVRREYRPGGTTSRREVWLLDLERGRWRIERPDAGKVAVFDGLTLRVFTGGKPDADLSARHEALGTSRMLREILPLPFSLFEPGGCDIIYAGREDNPGGARAWQRILVIYRSPARRRANERMLLYIRSETDGIVRRRTDMVDRFLLRWNTDPFDGRLMIAELGLYRRVEDISFATRWDFFDAGPGDKAGEFRRTGPLRRQVEIEEIKLGVPLTSGMFRRP